MTSDISPRPVSPLQTRMIEDMTVRGFEEERRPECHPQSPGSCGRFSARD
jgi:hypothetical protein